MEGQRWVREPEARSYLGGISHGAFYALTKSGAIKPIKIGRSCFFDLNEIDRYMEHLKAEQQGEPIEAA